MTLLADSSKSFLSARPEWTLAGASLACGSGADLTVQQTPFRWVDGVWETLTTIGGRAILEAGPTRVIVRIAPETLRVWKDAGINPFLEACAQLAEHLRQQARHGHLTSLTLL